jgi:helix-turn-helix, Psq domain
VYRALQAQGVSQRQAAKVLDVPRTTLQAWRAWQDSIDACPRVVEFFDSVPGLAFLHRLVMALHVVFVEIGACGIRLVCLFLQMTGLNRFVGASFGTQQQVNRHVEEAMVTYQREETARLAEHMPPQDITVTQDETFTGGLSLVGMEPVSNYIVLEQAAVARDQDTWNALMKQALTGLNCRVIQSTSDETPGLLAYVEHHRGAHHSPDLFH